MKKVQKFKRKIIKIEIQKMKGTNMKKGTRIEEKKKTLIIRKKVYDPTRYSTLTVDVQSIH